MFSYYEFHKYELDVIRNHRMVHYDTHMHDELELLYIFEGSQTVMADGKQYGLNKGSCLAIFPNQPHSYIRPSDLPKDNEGAESVMLFIPAQMLYSLYPDMHGCNTGNCMLTEDMISEDAVLGFNKIPEEKSLNAQLGWAQIILSNVIPQLSVTKVSAGNNPEIVSLIMRYVSENYLSSLTLEMLSEVLGISKYKISRIFSDKIKMSFRSYLGMLRSNHAAQLINTSNEALAKIAEQSGFESERSFYRVFKEIYGISPADYRRMVRKK